MSLSKNIESGKNFLFDISLLAEVCENFVSLNVCGCHSISVSKLLIFIQKYPNLKEIDILYCQQISDASIVDIAITHPELKVLI